MREADLRVGSQDRLITAISKGRTLVSAFSPPRSSEVEGESLGIRVEVDRKLPVADQVYEVLKEAIVEVQLLPGTSISENRICRHFGVSRTPVRSAIARLGEEGLIDVYPQQGSFVAPIRLAGMYDNQFVRRALEVAVLREAARRWTPAMSVQARTILTAQETAIAAGNSSLFHREDERFHQAFCSFAGREGVWATILAAKSRLGRFVRLFGRPERLPIVVEEHRLILDALDAGDENQAAERLEHHLEMIFVMLAQLREEYRPYVTD